MAEASTDLASLIRKEAARLGFAAIGFSSPTPQPLALQRFTDMIEEKRHGEMSYMEKRMEERANPSLLLSCLHTIISVAISYNYSLASRESLPKISKYALIEDYHPVVRGKLEKLLAAIKILASEPLTGLITVDSSPLLEKNWAEKAGIGKTGKNTLLQVPSAGSYLFLGEILLDRALPSSKFTLPNVCGSCSKCLEHCPTGALVEPGKIDASKCISYLTVELINAMPSALIFTGSRADSAKNSGKRNRLLDDLYGTRIVIAGNCCNKIGNIAACRASYFTGSHAVTIMLLNDALKTLAPHGVECLVLCFNDHSLRYRCITCWNKAVFSLDLDNAHPA